MSLDQLPKNLPEPVDDGGADGLLGTAIPHSALPSTNGDLININRPGFVVYYVYPMTGRPDTPLPDGWDEIPGARGCTPQSCSFRDHYSELRSLDSEVFGVSTQTTEYQLEARERLHLPFALLSDEKLMLNIELGLPTFEVAGMELYRRITLIARDGEICKVFYPVFPPGENAAEVLSWMRQRT